MQNLIVHFDFPQGTLEQYDKVWDDLRASGNEHPKGLLFHTGAAKPDGGLFVVDVWESEEAFQEFGKVLMPFIQKSGIPVTPPNFMHPRYLYMGQKETAFS